MDLKEVMDQLQRVERMAEGRRARRAPKENKLTKLRNPGTPGTYREFYADKNSRGEDVTFCVADYVNVAGYVLVWRETSSFEWRKGLVKRQRQWSAFATHEAALKCAKRRAEAFKKLMEKVREGKK